MEPSYVIRKFLDSQHIDNLTTYLQALHKNGQATEDHTTLLLNCYTKLNHTDKLKEFIMVSVQTQLFDKRYDMFTNVTYFIYIYIYIYIEYIHIYVLHNLDERS